MLSALLRHAAAVLRNEDGAVPIQFMFAALLVVILGGLTYDHAGVRWNRSTMVLSLDIPMISGLRLD